MKDLAFNFGDLALINKDIDFVEDSEAIQQELYVFLNIRACHKNKVGKIIFSGELEYDQNQGIDFLFVTDITTSIEQIRNHYIKQIKTYYGKYIIEINNFKINKDKVNRLIEITFDYVTIYSSKKQTFKTEVNA